MLAKFRATAILLFAFALVLTACGSDESGTSSDEGATENAQAETSDGADDEAADDGAEEPAADDGDAGADETAEAPAADADATIPAAPCPNAGKLRIAVWDEGLAPTVEAAAQQWVTDYCPEAEAVVEITPWNDYWETLQIAAGGGGDIADILWMSPVFMPFYQEVGAVQNMQGLLEAGGVDPSVWGPLANSYTFDGELYGAPINWDTVVIVANTDLLEQAGVEVPGDDWTWDDYAAAGEAVAALGDDIFGVGGHSAYQNGYGGFLASAGVAPVMSDDRTRCTLRDPESIATLEYFVDLVDRGVAPRPDDVGADPGNYFNMFLEGRLGMTTMGSWQIPALLEGADFGVTLLPMPANPDTGKSVSISNAIAYTISSSASDPALAANLVQYLSSDEGSQFWVDGEGFAPSNPNPDLQKGWIERYEGTPIDATVFADALDGAQAVTVFGLDRWNAVNGDLETRLFTNNEDPVEAADAICKIIETDL